MVSITYVSDQEMIHFSSSQDVTNKEKSGTYSPVNLKYVVFIPFWKQTVLNGASQGCLCTLAHSLRWIVLHLFPPFFQSIG